jgi:hypothetical protein
MGLPVPLYPYGLGQGGSCNVPYLLDFAALTKAGAFATTPNPNNADIIYFGKIPIGAQISGVLMDVLSAATDAGALTVTIGDYSDVTGDAITAAGYMAATSIKSTGYTGTVLTDAYGAATKVYSAVSYLALTLGGGVATTLTTGKLLIVAKMSLLSIPAYSIVSPALWH